MSGTVDSMGCIIHELGKILHNRFFLLVIKNERSSKRLTLWIFTRRVRSRSFSSNAFGLLAVKFRRRRRRGPSSAGKLIIPAVRSYRYLAPSQRRIPKTSRRSTSTARVNTVPLFYQFGLIRSLRATRCGN